MRFKLIGTLCIGLFCHSLAAKPSYQEWQTIDYIQKAFVEIALKNEFKNSDNRLIRWERPIQYNIQYIDMPPNQMISNLMISHLEHLEKITSHAIKPSPSQPNLKIIFTRGRNYAKAIKDYTNSKIDNLAKDSNCMGSLNVNSRNEITYATVIIPVDRVMGEGLLVACIVEESTQIMGLPNDSDWVFPSIANDKSKIELLTGLDYILLKLLYSKALKPGMDAHQIEPIIQKLLEKWQSERVIKRAPFVVNRFGLYPLVN